MADTLIERLAVVPEVGCDYRPMAISPDGGTLAFQCRMDGNWQLYLVDSLGEGRPRRLVEVNDPLYCPQFSSDGRYLYFARDDRGSECFDFYRHELSTGATENLLPDTPTLAPNPDFNLSPDGTRIAFSAQRGESYSAALMPAAPCPGGNGLTWLADHYYNDFSPVWSPDGSTVAWTTDTHGQDSAILLMDVASGSLKPLGGDEEHMLLAAGPSWSPDGHTLAFCGVDDDYWSIGLYDVALGTISWAWEGIGSAHHVVWAPDGRSLVFLLDEGIETGLWYLDLATRDLVCLSIGPGNHYHPSFTPDGGALLVTLNGPGRPNDIFRIELADGDVRALTGSLPDDLGDHAFVNGEPAFWTSRDRLTEVPGLVCRPEVANGSGVVIIHGGPTWHHSNEWDPLRQALVAAGCVVVHPNYRGSDGYTRTWQLGNRYLLGQGEAQDCAGAVDYLIAEGCDPARIAVTGRSHGGYLTMQMLTQFPELWACGVAGVPFMDHIDAQIDPAVRQDLIWWDRENCGDIEKDRARLEYYSPINHLDRIQAPLLLLAGELDPRCPPKQARQTAERLQAQGKVCEIVVYPDEGHEISGVEHRRDYDRRTVEFILEHLGLK